MLMQETGKTIDFNNTTWVFVGDREAAHKYPTSYHFESHG